jgi:hypothetical protein
MIGKDDAGSESEGGDVVRLETSLYRAVVCWIREVIGR